MNQCVPTGNTNDDYTTNFSLYAHSNSVSSDLPISGRPDFQVTELTWQNGQLTHHGLYQPPPPKKQLPTPSKYSFATGTLESIVNQATRLSDTPISDGDMVGPLLNEKRVVTASPTMTLDALVPDSKAHSVRPTGVVGCSTHAESCSGPNNHDFLLAMKRAKTVVARRPRVPPEWSKESGSATFGANTLDTYDREFSVGFTSTSLATSPEDSSSLKHDSFCHNGVQSEAYGEEEKKKGLRKSSVSTKRSRAAAIHNQSERKRRDKINQRIKTLQKLIPNSNKMDKASILDEVIEYLKQLQAQISMMGRLNVPPMMLPIAMQQLQMAMMSQMGMGMGVMDMNPMLRNPNMASAATSHVLPNYFMPMSWDGVGEARSQNPPGTIMSDPMSILLASQSHPHPLQPQAQPMGMGLDSYSRMVAMCQQMQQGQPSNSKI